MSITGLSETSKLSKKSFHCRNDSDELDVFEASRYFSGYNEVVGYNGATYTQKVMREDHRHPWRGGRMSLDVPMRNPLPQQSLTVEKQILKEKIDGFSDKTKSLGHQYLEKDRKWVDQYPPERKEFRKFDEVDDGAESDSSSDLFELQNYDLGIYSSGLPVYETTHMDSIKRGAPISNGTL
ncbi:hypothetical protein GH714_029167 [Hevea brasiliensis]|uniref:Uncharacterized protein n=1 Tax=Hevea brasiliensis TaxID=3981 RepID=A0A6A6NJQ0_HEVBR|nr:hypothetical protein GH714_029167 [Hevea brasiliensis]